MRIKFIYWLFIVTTAVLIVPLFYVFCKGEVIRMVTVDRVEVVATGAEWLKSKMNVLGVLERGQHAEVAGCQKLKSGTVPRIRFGSKDFGYVVDRRYMLERGPVSSASLLSPRSIVLSCAGKLRRMSTYH
jgi:hypothetical protein